MDFKLFEKIQINSERFVSAGVTEYERKFTPFEVDLTKQKFLKNGLDIISRIIIRVANNEEISIIPLRDVLLTTLFELDFNFEIFIEVYKQINLQLISFITKESNYDANTVRIFNSYERLIRENAGDYVFYSGSTVINILQTQPEYQYSDTINTFYPLEVSNNKIYTLFPKERYWDVISDSQGAIKISDTDLVIYNNELYKLNPEVSLASENFNEEEWIKYKPKRFNLSRSFNSVYVSKIRSVFGKIADDGFDVNSITSDSFVPIYSPEARVVSDEYVASFGGAGKQILQTINQLNVLSNSLGGYQGSLIGGLEYISEFVGYLLLASFGRDIPDEGEIVDGVSVFGKFNFLFASKTSDNKIPGLKFLEKFANLKSFVHNQQIQPGLDGKTKITYNPIYEQFRLGINDTFKTLKASLSYLQSTSVDLLLYSVQSVLQRCDNIGDLTQAGINSLNSMGQTPGYEGLGSVSAQLKALQNVFPPSGFFRGLPRDVKVGPGFTGAIRYFLLNYSKFSKEVIDPIFPGRSLEFLPPWIDKINNKLGELIEVIESIGIGSKSFIPNLSFKTFLYQEDKLIDFLRSLGFRDSEIEQLLSAKDLNELIAKFAPLSSSADLRSFFRAYELTQLIYEMAGDAGINTYLSFLYSTSPLDSLLNILKLSEKEKSTATNLNISKYPRLIGLLIGLTYAVDPNQLIKFSNILGANNLSLLESVSFLFQQGEDTIIKSPDSVQLLAPVIDQIITGYYELDSEATQSQTYSQANSLSPIGLRTWTKLIGDNLGRVEGTDLIHHLYDKSIGITPKELISILNNPSSPNVFGALVDGFGGGEFTTFLRYVNLTGLGFKLGFYKNSYQVNNFEVGDKAVASFLPNLISEAKSLIESLSIFKTVFDSSLDYNFKYDQDLVRSIDPFIKAQNKVFETIPLIIEQQTRGASVEQLEQAAGGGIIAESPGIGNSRLPNRIPVSNSITPEQTDILLGEQRGLLEFTTISQQNLSTITKFIKFSQENRLASSIQSVEENAEVVIASNAPKTYIPGTKFETNIRSGVRLLGREEESFTDDTLPTLSKEYSVPVIYQEGVEVRSSGLGANYISPTLDVVDSSVVAFDPIKSCQRFGGVNCAELYQGLPDRCVNPINKSLLPEEYTSIPAVLPTSVSIDRPLGTFANYIPSRTVIPISSFTTPPSYYSLLPTETIPGKGAEPVLNTIFSTPLVFEVGSGEVNEYNDTEFALVEFIRSKLEKNSEFECASFSSPYLYQVCMNVMKCKRYVPPTLGKNFLDFCPKTLSGGRLK
jgi:hypothetical protein